MISSTVRRAAFSAQSSPVITCVASTGPRAAATQALSYRPSYQRRCSSSKPSSPDNGSKGVTEGQTVPAAPAQTRSDDEKKPAARSNRRKARDVAASCTMKARDETMQNLPSVPSTHHVKGKEIAASAFFSLYRPISVTSSFPKAITDEAFAAIFTPRTRSNNKPSDVISMLSSTVHKLEAATQQERWNAETDELRAAITAEANQTEGDIKHLDQNPGESSIPFPQHILSGEYQPFNPPPPPRPMNSAQSLAAGAEAATTAPQHRTYKAVLTIEESTDANGEVTYMAHSSPLIADVSEPFLPSSESQIQEPRNAPTSFRERMNIRQERYGEFLHRKREEQPAIWAISVKRQRKLKMKKHKYKKLMRRTRNLRRRLDRN